MSSFSLGQKGVWQGLQGVAKENFLQKVFPWQCFCI
jgi:hypothetical protein